jgi:hypothetical protein
MQRKEKGQPDRSFELARPWMINLPEQLISELSLPGTHDSGCNKDCGILKCQDWSIKKQLTQGIRFLDIRCRHVEDKFHIHHDFIYCGLSLGDVLSICRDFLAAYPSEAIVMRIKEEFMPHQCSRNFHYTFDDYVKEYSQIIHLSERIPTLNEIRGKVWIILNFDHDNVSAFGWKDANIQDMWKIDNEVMIRLKIQKIEEQVRLANNGDKNSLFLNFFSGTGEYAWPKTIAKMTNKVVLKFSGKLGISIFDFPCRGVINHTIAQNKFVSPIPLKSVTSNLFNGLDQTLILIFTKFCEKYKNQLNEQKNLMEKMEITKHPVIDIDAIEEAYKNFIKNEFQYKLINSASP